MEVNKAIEAYSEKREVKREKYVSVSYVGRGTSPDDESINKKRPKNQIRSFLCFKLSLS